MIQFSGNNDPGISLEDVLYRIEYADSLEIDEMIDALQKRYNRLFPGWEVMFLSMKTGDENEIRESAQRMIDFIRRHDLHEA